MKTQLPAFPDVLQDAYLNRMRMWADEPADTAISELVEAEGPQRAKEIFDLLIRNIDMPLEKLPPSLVNFIAEHSQLPEWADLSKIKKANELFVDHGPKFLIFLYFKSLPLLYSCANGAQVLIQTGRLAHGPEADDRFSRRIAETGQFLINVMAENSLQPGSFGMNAILKVRLIHASIRHFIPVDHWDEQLLGKPINQEDLSITLMTFSIAILDALEQFNVAESTERKLAYLHRWNVIGHVLGIRTEMLPQTLEEARAMLEKILSRQSSDSPAGRTLTAALIKFTDSNLKNELFRNIPQMLIRFLTGDERANSLGVGSRFEWLAEYLPAFISRLFNFIERLEDQSLPLRVIIDQISVELTKKMVLYFNDHKKASFHVPEKLQQAWHIK